MSAAGRQACGFPRERVACCFRGRPCPCREQRRMGMQRAVDALHIVIHGADSVWYRQGTVS